MGVVLWYAVWTSLSWEYQFLSRASRKFAATPRRKPFLIAHVLRVHSHSCSMRFLVCVAVELLILGSYVAGLLGSMLGWLDEGTRLRL
jgi:hypothetical protein